MIVKRIHIKLEVEYSKIPSQKFLYQFYLRSRHIFNFIERECLKKLRREADYDTISIEVRHGFDPLYMQPAAEVIYHNVLRIILPFNLEEYRQLSTLNEYYIFIEKILVDTLEVVGDRFNFPGNEILESYHNFLQQGCKNTWILQSKILDKESKLKVQLKGQLTESKFILEYLLYVGKTLVATQTVFTGDPDELIFSNIVKEVYWDGRYIVISGKNGVIKRLPLEYPKHIL